MERKDVLVGTMFTAIALFVIPIFVNVPWMKTVLRPIAYLIMFLGMVFFVAGDTIMKKIKKDKRTDEEVLNAKKKEYQHKIDLQVMQLELEKKKAEVEKVRVETQKMQGNKKGKMPDVLGNLGDLFIKR